MQPITRPIRWGILGTGAIAAAFASSLRQVTDATLIAVARAAKRLPIPLLNIMTLIVLRQLQRIGRRSQRGRGVYRNASHRPL